MMLAALIIVQGVSVSLEGSTLPHVVSLDCRAVTSSSDEILRVAASVEYSGGEPSENHHIRVTVEPVNSDFPRAETRPVWGQGRCFTNEPFAVVQNWRGQRLVYNFELPTNLGSVAENGVARLDVMAGQTSNQRIATGLCAMTVESRDQ